jgi:AraC family transcriptional regulator of adaptative response / DNA-3-methyladenine glycosylase II
VTTLEPDACYRALRTRDPRFDGRFFTAVRSTGVYCRPICPARTPRIENCWFVPCAAAAQEAGFRPCLRCRPEASPGTPAWLGTSATVSRALRLIAQGALDQGAVDDLAQRLGIGERHLRRLFATHLGASPVAVAQTRRVLFAKQLLDQTTLPMSQVALASGFSSIRRFNDAMSRSYDRPPSSLRRRRASTESSDGSTLELLLPYRPPFHWNAITAYLAPRAIPGVEFVRPGVYRRTLRLPDGHGRIEVRAAPEHNHLRARLWLPSPAALIEVHERLRRLFDLSADPHEIGAHLGRDPILRSAVAEEPGVRVPGAWDGFEMAVRVVLGQQVSVKGATTLAGRLVAAYGERIPEDAARSRGEPEFLFPTAAVLARARLARIGLTRARAAAISGLARAVANREVLLDGTRDPDETRARLAALPGIGPWTVQVISMRALREPDAFPSGDLGLRRALGRNGGLASSREVASAAAAWSPWRAYAAMLLWTRDRALAAAA